MPSFPTCAKGALLAAVSLLSACATVSDADLAQPNFGRQVFPHFDASVDPDPMALSNGIYASPSIQDRCYRCSSWSQFNSWSSWTP
ncbi:MAG: hypothetical protein WBF89_05525 [Steroidobacteraceae bacterium]